MYVPKKHQAPSHAACWDYIRSNGFGTLIGTYEDRPIAAHIPLLLDENDSGKKIIHGHVSRANNLKHCFDGEQTILATFINTHAYVSSSWYDHVNVPTWNYVSVHVYGKAKVLDGPTLESSVRKLVEKYESGRKERFSVDDLSLEMKKREFRGIIGFELIIEEMQAAYKLSQNRNKEDFQNIIFHLENENLPGASETALEMKKLES